MGLEMQKARQSSPMFPLFTKKRGSALESPEPSSAKVACIGQVRVKTKKQGKKLRLRSRKRNNTTTLRSHSLRSHQTQKQECLPYRNQRLVHLPITICGAARACCVSHGSSSCGVTYSSFSSPACCARWFVCLHEGDRNERAIEFVVGDEEEFETSKRKGHRKHVFEDIEIDDESKFVQVHEQCVPPKNALLLMRFRSDPLKMSALVNQFCESPLREYDEEVEKQEIQIVQANSIAVSEQERAENHQEKQEIEEEKQGNGSPSAEDATLSSSCTEVVELQENDAQDNEETGPSLYSSLLASLLHSEAEEEQSREDNHERSESEQNMHIDNLGEERKHQEEESQMVPECLLLMMYEPKLSMEVSKETWVCSTDFIRVLPRKHVNNANKKKSDSKDETKKLVISNDSSKQQQLQLQPRRSSCHYPSAVAAEVGYGGGGDGFMAAMIEQKPGISIKGSEPLGLSRCKSEPMRSSAKFAPAQDA